MKATTAPDFSSISVFSVAVKTEKNSLARRTLENSSADFADANCTVECRVHELYIIMYQNASYICLLLTVNTNTYSCYLISPKTSQNIDHFQSPITYICPFARYKKYIQLIYLSTFRKFDSAPTKRPRFSTTPKTPQKFSWKRCLFGFDHLHALQIPASSLGAVHSTSFVESLVLFCSNKNGW